MIIVGLSGKKGVGKNTVATLITQSTKKWCFEIAFAGALKQEVALACGVTIEHIDKNKQQFRPILQWWGADFRRISEPQYLVYKLDNILTTLYKDGKAEVIIVTDVRFQNEYDYLKSIGAKLIRVSRPLDVIDNHKSETDLDKVHEWDDIILNTGTIEELKLQVKELITKYKL